MKLKLNLLFNDIAHRFGISKGLASRITHLKKNMGEL
jgi:hypothetical protein